MLNRLFFYRNKIALTAITLFILFGFGNDVSTSKKQIVLYKNKPNQKYIQTKLTSFVTLDSLGAASGIVYHNKNIYLISDNSGFLFQYNIELKNSKKYPLISDLNYNISKKIKPDFESISILENKICIYGSGSTEKRRSKITFDLTTQQHTSEDMTECYKKFQAAASLTDNEFNIEGVFYDKIYSYYCQRGNKSANKNCIIRYHRKSEKIDVFYFTFPKIGGINATFTDAILLDKTIYFLASSENTISTYYDGEIMGTVFGTINVETMTVQHEEIISYKHKFEGITLQNQTKNEMNFFLCEDNDTDEIKSEIFKLSVTKLF